MDSGPVISVPQQKRPLGPVDMHADHAITALHATAVGISKPSPILFGQLHGRRMLAQRRGSEGRSALAENHKKQRHLQARFHTCPLTIPEPPDYSQLTVRPKYPLPILAKSEPRTSPSCQNLEKKVPTHAR